MARRPTTSTPKPGIVSAPTEVPAPQAAKLAPWPHVDRYPTVLGSNLTLSSISSAFRLAQTGYRQQYVDVLNELIEREPHGFAVISQRILTVAGGRVELVPPECADSEMERAEEIADACRRMVLSLPGLAQSLAALLWAIYYGVSTAETSWSKTSGLWQPTRLHFVHPRRLSYPDQFSWELRIWDQGLVMPIQSGKGYGTERIFGLRVDDYPGKFVVHTPQLRGDYPTRDGLGRELAYWFAIKSIAARGAPAYLERFARPWPIAYYATQDDGKPRAAQDADKMLADSAVASLGTGTLSSATLPDSIRIALEGAGGSGTGRPVLTYEQWIAICNAEISKVVLSQTFTTETGKFGSRSTADTGEQSQLRNAVYDAAALAETLKRDLVQWIVRLNWPEDIHLTPTVVIHVEDEPDANQRLELAAKAAQFGIPVDADAMADILGLPVVPNEEKDEAGNPCPRRMMPLTWMDPEQAQALADPEKLEEQQQAAADAQAAKVKALAKAKPTPGNDAAATKDEPLDEAAE